MSVSSTAVWLLLVLAMLAVFVARVSRSLGPVGLIVTVILIIVLVRLARDLLQALSRRSDDGDQRAATKNVTPQEGWLQPGDRVDPRSLSGSERGSGPSVVIVEPQDGTERLEAKLEALDRLRATGAVTDAEYEAKRAQLIADF